MLVAGFQGVSTSRDVTTLGRGGSDTTAVALAAAVGADVCEIYTDVDGVFSADPRIVPNARKLPVLSFEEMLEMSASGAKVLQLRSVEYARNYGVRIHCRSELRRRLRYLRARGRGDDGTTPDHRRDPLDRGGSRDAHRRSRTGPASPARIFGTLADADVNVDMIVQNEPVSEDRRPTCPSPSRARTCASRTRSLEGLDRRARGLRT